MKVNIYAVFDSQMSAFMAPFNHHNDQTALRYFVDGVKQDPKSQLALHPGHYALFRLGSFNSENAAYVLETAPVRLGLLQEFLSVPDINGL